MRISTKDLRNHWKYVWMLSSTKDIEEQIKDKLEDIRRTEEAINGLRDILVKRLK